MLSIKSNGLTMRFPHCYFSRDHFLDAAQTECKTMLLTLKRYLPSCITHLKMPMNSCLGVGQVLLLDFCARHSNKGIEWNLTNEPEGIDELCSQEMAIATQPTAILSSIAVFVSSVRLCNQAFTSKEAHSNNSPCSIPEMNSNRIQRIIQLEQKNC